MPYDRMRALIHPDGTRVILEIGDKEKQTQEILTTGDLDDLIQQLINLRAGLKPIVPADLPNAAPMLDDPLINVVDFTVEGKRPIFLRHPGIGWFAIGIPVESAKQLAGWLATDVPEKPGMAATKQ